MMSTSTSKEDAYETRLVRRVTMAWGDDGEVDVPEPEPVPVEVEKPPVAKTSKKAAALTKEATTMSSYGSDNDLSGMDNTSPPSTGPTEEEPGCVEKFGDKVEGFISGSFFALGNIVGYRPKQTIFACFVLTILMGIGFISWETENRGEELWVPQDTTAEAETEMYTDYYGSTSRIESMIVQSTDNTNVLTKSHLVDAMKMHNEIATRPSTYENTTGTHEVYESNTFTDLCVRAGGSCVDLTDFTGICGCLLTSILKQWNYDLETLQADDDIMTTINSYGNELQDLLDVLGNPIVENNKVVSAEAFTLTYFLAGDPTVVDGTTTDPVNEQWEADVFLDVAGTVDYNTQLIFVDYFSTRSFGDEFGDEITSDLLLVQISYAVVFIYLGANLGSKLKCGPESRWTMSLSALVMVGLSTAAGFGLSSMFGLFFGPVHSLLPFILLGIGVDDAFVIVNAFNRERKGLKRSEEDNTMLIGRTGRSLARAGASITVTSATDLVAFGISATSSLPALASFCGYAAISIFFLWLFASTFFTGTMVLDERRQRDNRRECFCCLTRKKPLDEEDIGNQGFEEDRISRYFRNYHAPAILSKPGKIIVGLIFAGLLAFGLWGAINLEVEDTERAFIPSDSYLQGYFNAADEYFPEQGIKLYIVFEDSTDIYNTASLLGDLDKRVTGLSEESPYIAEPISKTTYRNVMTGLSEYLNGTWPSTESEFVQVMQNYITFGSPGEEYGNDVVFNSDKTAIDAIRVQLEYVRLTKLNAGEIIDDADKQIEAMDDTRLMVESWTDLAEGRFPYSEKFITIEGFKIIKSELYTNVGLAILAVGVIVFLTVASPMTAILITVNVAACIVEILGFMKAFGIVIDSVSVINIVLAVGLSVDYSAHVGHCFMVKGGTDKDRRALEALADIGAAVLSGAISTFLAVVVLLFSSSYVFVVLSKQFALTVALGVSHGLICLPVLLSVFGPKPFTSAELPDEDHHVVPKTGDNDMTKTAHPTTESFNEADNSNSSKEEK